MAPLVPGSVLYHPYVSDNGGEERATALNGHLIPHSPLSYLFTFVNWEPES